jgi:hypothetical protein
MNSRYTEEVQLFHPAFNFIYSLLLLVAAYFIIVYPFDPAMTIPIILLFGIPLLFGRLTIRIDSGSLLITFGFVNLVKKRILLREIVDVESVTYRPLRDFGGWGIRSGKFRGERTGCYNLKGNEGVLLILSRDMRVCLGRTKRVIVGSQRPGELAEAIKTYRGSISMAVTKKR